MIRDLAALGYGVAGIVFLLIALPFFTVWRGRWHGMLLAASVLVTGLWCLALGYGAYTGRLSEFQIFILETMRASIWLVFMSSLLGVNKADKVVVALRVGGAALVGTILSLGCLLYLTELGWWIGGNPTEWVTYALLPLALCTLVLTEQVFRNLRRTQRDGIKYLCVGIGAMSVYDVFLYSDALLHGMIRELFWSTRGFVFAVCAPLIVIGVRKIPAISASVFVSRHIVVYSATLIGSGIYLIVVALLGYYLQYAGGAWGAVVQILLSFVAFIVLFVYLFSDQAHARLRVLVSKHFYKNKYDYRQEWLRLIETLTDNRDGPGLRKRGIKALAEIIGAPRGKLWLQHQDSAQFCCTAGWNIESSGEVLEDSSSLVAFLRKTGWVIDTQECIRTPESYEGLELAPLSELLPDAAIIVPLIHHVLLGFVVLEIEPGAERLNFEDHDLLKTVGQQIASYLAQEISTEQLAESRQFEAFNRLTAYIMHDLKNLIAQQSLVVENAAKHKSNPLFFDDAIETIRGCVVRMRGVIASLRQGSSAIQLQTVEIGDLVRKVVSSCGDRDPKPEATIDDRPVYVRTDRDRLDMALQHTIRNAQDATTENGAIRVGLELIDGAAVIVIEDDGCGMDENFVQERLFRPFDSTKKGAGMGIGAYQLREAVRLSKGVLTVKSERRVGTVLNIRLPAV